MFEDRAGRGAALLDRERPGWAGEVANQCLDMMSCSQCVLGRLYGTYSRGLLSLIDSGLFARGGAVSEHGFTLAEAEWDRPADEVMADFRALAYAWRAEIRRRAGDGGA